MVKKMCVFMLLLFTAWGVWAQKDSMAVVTDSTAAVVREEKLVSPNEEEKSTSKEISASIAAGFGEEVLVPVVAIVSVFGMPVLLVFLVLLYRERERKARFQLMEKAVEAGRELPADFFKEKMVDPSAPRGVVVFCLGIGLLLTLFFWNEFREFAPIAFVPIFVGIGQFIVWKLNKRQADKEKSSDKGASEL